ncbi:MAG: MFS transporter, partial [Myxococcales bacterium]|nr:MFS transporter [Myxococcales bacterium]
MGARPRLWVILLTVFVDLLGFGLVIPVGPYYATAYGATETQVALLTGAYSLPQLFLVPFWGRLSDRWGRRPTMLLSIAGTTVAMALF